MSINDIFVGALLSTGVLLFAFTAIGLLLTRNLSDSIHYLAPGTLVGSVAITGAVFVHERFTQSGVKAILIMLLLVIANPILSHATARAGRIRQKHQLPPKSDERFPFAKERM